MQRTLFKSGRRQILKAGLASALFAPISRVAAAEDHIPGNVQKKPRTGRDSISPLMQSVSSYLATAGRTALPDPVTEAAKHHVVDTLAAMMSGTKLLPGEAAIRYVRTLGGTADACVPGTDIVTNVVNAALTGGMLAQADETDDSHEPSLTHPGCSIVPASLAMAERQGANGTSFLRAVVLGYDICTRLSVALGSYKFFADGHSTHAFGPTFGAAAASGSLAGLDADKLRYMLSFAAQQASGVSYQQRDLQHIEKAFDLGGMPARNGVTAATMVASGMTGVEDAFSGERNFFFAYGSHARPDELVRDLGKTFEIVNTSLKKWSVGSPAQAPLDSLYDLMHANRFAVADIDQLTIRLSHQGANVVNNRNVPDICMQHLAAVMLIDGGLTFASAHDEERMRDPKVLELRKRIVLLGDDELDRVMPSRQAIVELTLHDGRVLRSHTTQVRGTPRNPMNRQEIEEKCVPLMGSAIGEARAQQLVKTLWHIEDMHDLKELRPLLMI